MSTSLPVLAGSVSTAIFIASTLPMLVKAATPQDLASYSLGNILLANIGNVTYAGMCSACQLGPVWALHGFHLCATGLMLFFGMPDMLAGIDDLRRTQLTRVARRQGLGSRGSVCSRPPGHQSVHSHGRRGCTSPASRAMAQPDADLGRLCLTVIQPPRHVGRSFRG